MRLVPFFNPRSISGCQLWLDGADPNGTGVLPTNGSTVSSWIDKSGNARNLTGSGTPTFLSGGGINFNGTNAFYTNTNFAYNLSIRSVFLVAKLNTYLQYAGFITFIPNPSSGVDQNSITGMSVETASSAALSFNQNLSGPSPVYSSALTATLTNVNLYNDNMNGTIGSGFVNGNTITNITTASTAGTTSGFGVGTRWQGSMSLSYLFSGNIYDIILYTGPLTTNQRQQIEGYLAWKWGLQGSLPSNHPFKVNPFSPLVPVAIPRSLQINKSGVLIDPRTISNCIMWLDSADVSTFNLSGTNILTWRDKSGNANNATVSATAYATYSTNPLGVYFNNSLYLTPYTADPTNETVFLVFNFTGGTSQQIMIGAYSGGRSISIYNDLATMGIIKALIGWGPTVAYTRNRVELATAVITAGSSQSISINAGNPATGGAVTYNSGNVTILGREAGVQLGYVGYIHEIVIYNRVLTATEQNQMQGYLAWKWGFQTNLPSSHAFRQSPPTPFPQLRLPQIMRAAFRPIVTRFTYTGAAQTYTVPANTSLIYVYLWGAGGGRDANLTGAGAFVSGTVNVSPGATYSIVVGKNGNTNGTVRGTMAQGGGGLGQYSYFGGGGFSGIFSGASLVIGSLVAIAGGGGTASFSRLGGSGGVITGGSGSSTNGGYPGTGGTQTAGGTTLPGTFTVTYGEQFFGGAGRIEGPGGGGGYYGGGGSDCRFQPGQLYAGSGGGSSYTGGFASILGTADGVAPNGSTTTQPGGTTNQYYVAPWGAGLQHGYAVIVTLAP